MMSKLVFVLAAICAFALADEVKINDFPCMWHVSYDYYDENIDFSDTPDGEANTLIHEYGMIDDSVFFVYEKGFLLSDPEQMTYSGVIRGDKFMEKKEGVDYYYCYYNYTVKSKKPCEQDTCPSARNPPFTYGTKIENVECVDGSMGCTNYTSEDGKTTVMINRAGRYVIDPEGYVYTWYNDIGTLDMFETYFCGNDTVIPAPEKPICETDNGIFEPDGYPCFYHLSYPWEDEDNNRTVIVHEKGMYKDKVNIYLELGYNVSDENDEYYHAIIRGDIEVSPGVYYRVDYDRNEEGEYDCSDEDGEDNMYDNPSFAYVSKEEKLCPESTEAKCMYYTNITGDTVIVNANNQYIVHPDGWEIKWYDDGFPTVEDFAKYKKCDGSDLSVPTNVCQQSSSHSSSSSHGSPSSHSSSSSHGAPSSGKSSSSAAPDPSSAALHSVSVSVIVLAAVALLL